MSDNTDPTNPRFYFKLAPIIAEGKLRITLENNYRLDLSIGDKS
jgi:hypothetical protein